MRTLFLYVPLLLVMSACASSAKLSDQEVLSAILSVGQVDGNAPSDKLVGAHHLEQHPDNQCRRQWRNADLAIHMPTRKGSLQNGAFIAYARSLVGKPYRYGATGSKGFDCSGLVNRIFAEFGWDLPRNSRAMSQVGVVLKNTPLQVGDLVFFDTLGEGRISHVGVMLGADAFIHASSGRSRVVVDSLQGRYYQKRLVGARRIFSLPPGRYSSAGGGARDDTLFYTLEAARRHFPGPYGPCLGPTFAGVR